MTGRRVFAWRSWCRVGLLTAFDLLELLLTTTFRHSLSRIWHYQSKQPQERRNKVTHIFQTLKRPHHTVDRSIRHPADLFSPKKKGSSVILSYCSNPANPLTVSSALRPICRRRS